MMNVAKQSIQRVKRGSSCEIKKVQGSSYALFFHIYTRCTFPDFNALALT